jgi:hypothetical protein
MTGSSAAPRNQVSGASRTFVVAVDHKVVGYYAKHRARLPSPAVSAASAAICPIRSDPIRSDPGGGARSLGY